MAESNFEKRLARTLQGWAGFFSDAFTALAVNGISGDYVEFGSASGTTMWFAYEHMRESNVPRHLWGFDSFEGLPERADPRDQHPSFHPGVAGEGLEGFHANLDRHGVPRDAYTTVVGFYEDTLPALGSDGSPTDIALAYVDCNFYSSTVEALRFLEPRLKHGMIVAFDDWFCWSPTEISGERIALEEFTAQHPEWRFTRFKDVHWGGLAFVVEAVPPGSAGR